MAIVSNKSIKYYFLYMQKTYYSIIEIITSHSYITNPRFKAIININLSKFLKLL